MCGKSISAAVILVLACSAIAQTPATRPTTKPTAGGAQWHLREGAPPELQVILDRQSQLRIEESDRLAAELKEARAAQKAAKTKDERDDAKSRVSDLEAKARALAKGDQMVFPKADAIGDVAMGFIGQLTTYQGFVIIQKIDDKNAIVGLQTVVESADRVRTGSKRGGRDSVVVPKKTIVATPVWLAEIDASGFIDGREGGQELSGYFVARKSRTYTTADGASKSVLQLVPFDPAKDFIRGPAAR